MTNQVSSHNSTSKYNKLSAVSLYSLAVVTFAVFVFLPYKLLNDFSISPWIVVSIFTTVAFIIYLSSVKVEWIAFLAMVLLSFVRWEPAPVDLIIVMLLIISLIKRENIDRIKSPSITHLFVFLFLITNFTALYNILDYKEAVTYSLISLYLVGFFYFIKMYSVNATRIVFLLRGYVVGALISIILSFAGLMGIGTEIVLFGGRLWTDNFFRFQGFFKDPNVFGAFLVPAVIISIESFYNKNLLRLNNPIKMIILLTLLSGVILSFSRAALLNLFLALVVYFGIKAIKKKITKKLVVTFVASIIFLSLSIFAVSQFISPATNYSNDSASVTGRGYDSERFKSQGQALMIAIANPLGVGPGQFPIHTEIGTHQLYLRLLSEQSIFGLIGFVGLISLIMTRLIKADFKDNAFAFSLTLIIIGSLVGIIFSGLFIDTLHWRHFWLFLALGWAVSEFTKHKTLKYSTA